MKTLKIAALLSTSLFFVGCQSTTEQKAEEIIETNKQTDYLSEAKASLDALQIDINKSKKDNLNYFSPEIYEEAIEAYQDAFSLYTEIINGYSSLSFKSKTEQYEEAKLSILSHISLSKQKLKLAYSVKNTAETTLAETFSQKQRLDELNAVALYPRDYKRISKEIDKLVEMIAEGDVTEAQKDQPQLLSKMVAIEVRAVTHIELGAIEQKITKFKKSRRNQYVPMSYQNLLLARNKASSTIANNPRDVDNIKTAVDATKYELAHVYHLANEVIKLKQTKSKNYEAYILAYENNLEKIATAIGLGPIKDLTLTQQVDEISNQGIVLKQNLSTTETDMANLKGNSDKATTALEQQKELFTKQLQELDSKNKILEENYATLQAAHNNTEIELIKLQAYKEAIDSINQSAVVKEQAKKSANQAALPQAKKVPEIAETPKNVEAQPVTNDVTAVEPTTKAEVPAAATETAEIAPAAPAIKSKAPVSAPSVTEPIAEITEPAATIETPAASTSTTETVTETPQPIGE